MSYIDNILKILWSWCLFLPGAALFEIARGLDWLNWACLFGADYLMGRSGEIELMCADGKRRQIDIIEDENLLL